MDALHKLIADKLNKRLTKDKINSCLVYSDGQLIYQYFRNNKMKQKVHKINSVTKSILSILIGIAIDQKKITHVDQPISEYFPGLDECKKEITIRHLLTMTPGYDWPEFTTWGGRPMPMINSKDWVKFVLEREMVEKPGQQMRYDSGASHLLSAILQKASGQPLTEFAEKNLFRPLGIKYFVWHTDSKGIAIGGFGLSLNPYDMLKIGILMMNQGNWGNKQVVSREWVQASTTGGYHSPYFGQYGLHWWVLTDENHIPVFPHTFFAMGYGGQYIIITPDCGMITIFTSDNYAETHKPLNYFREEILPVFT